MSEQGKDTHTLSGDEMWARAAQGGPIRREELGIQSSQSSNGTIYLNEGVQGWTFELNNDKNSSDK